MAARTWATGVDTGLSGWVPFSVQPAHPAPTQQYSCKYSPGTLKDTKLLGGGALVSDWCSEKVLGEGAGTDSVLLSQQLLIGGMVTIIVRAGAAGQRDPAGQAVFTMLLIIYPTLLKGGAALCTPCSFAMVR